MIDLKLMIVYFLKFLKIVSDDRQVAFASSNMKGCLTTVVSSHNVALIFVGKMFENLKFICFCANMENSLPSVFEDHVLVKLLVHYQFIFELL